MLYNCPAHSAGNAGIVPNLRLLNILDIIQVDYGIKFRDECRTYSQYISP